MRPLSTDFIEIDARLIRNNEFRRDEFPIFDSIETRCHRFCMIDDIDPVSRFDSDQLKIVRFR